MRLCKDCAHYTPNHGAIVGPLCEGLTYVSMITGETKLETCADARAAFGRCGPAAAHFVPATAFAEADATVHALTHGA